MAENRELKFPVDQSDRLKSKIVFQPYEIVGANFKFTPATNAGSPEFERRSAARAGLTPITLNKIEDSKVELFLASTL